MMTNTVALRRFSSDLCGLWRPGKFGYICRLDVLTTTNDRPSSIIHPSLTSLHTIPKQSCHSATLLFGQRNSSRDPPRRYLSIRTEISQQSAEDWNPASERKRRQSSSKTPPAEMKSAHVFPKGNGELEVKIQDIPIPAPGPDQVLIKVVVAGTNPKDWKYPLFVKGAAGLNTGDDVAGYVEAVGAQVAEFKPGDRVAAFHHMGKPHGAFAEYAIAWAKTTFHLPESTSFEEAATIPLAAMTAVVGLFSRLGLPEPWVPVSQARDDARAGGVVVYGAASAVGAFAVKLLVRSNIHPIIAVAGRGIPFVDSLLDKSKGDTVVDYRGGEDKVVAGLRDALPEGQRLLYAFDAVSEKGSYGQIAKVLDPHGHITLVLPGKKYEGLPETLHQTITSVGSVHGTPDDLSDLGYAWFRLFGLGLKEGWFKGHPYEVVHGGLGGVQTGLENLKNGKASAVKYVYRIDDTEGVDRSKI